MSVCKVYSSNSGLPDELGADLIKPKHTGAEGKIYYSLDNQYAIKIYHPAFSTQERKTHLDQVILLGRNLKDEEKGYLAWPIATVSAIDGKNSLGSVMRRVPPTYNILLKCVFSPRVAMQQFRSGKSWANYLQIARGIARAAEKLHTMGIAHTDFSYNNFLCNTETGDAVLIDLDSLVVPGFLPVKVNGTKGFMAPEVTVDPKNNPPKERSDRHALAVNILYTLLFRNPMTFLTCHDPVNQENDDKLGFGKEAVFSEHPTNHLNRPEKLGAPLFKGGRLSYRILTLPLQKLTEQALIDGLFFPDKRPTAREWAKALNWAIDELCQCANCKLHFIYPHWLQPRDRICPFCGTRVSTGSLSVLHLYEPAHNGQFKRTQRCLVLARGWSVYADVLDPNRNPPISRKAEPKIGHVEVDTKRNINILINDENTTWQARASDSGSALTVPRGGSVALTRGSIIHFGIGRRLMIVAE